jgi:hypothetical protein
MTYRTIPVDQKLAALEARKAQLEARIQKEKAKLAARSRKDDTRRKVIAGALALEHQDEAFQATLFRLLNRSLKRPDDRALFDLPPRAESPEADKTEEQGNAPSASAALAAAVNGS